MDLKIGDNKQLLACKILISSHDISGLKTKQKLTLKSPKTLSSLFDKF
jgi:hypothetical protein